MAVVDDRGGHNGMRSSVPGSWETSAGSERRIVTCRCMASLAATTSSYLWMACEAMRTSEYRVGIANRRTWVPVLPSPWSSQPPTSKAARVGNWEQCDHVGSKRRPEYPVISCTACLPKYSGGPLSKRLRKCNARGSGIALSRTNAVTLSKLVLGGAKSGKEERRRRR